VYAVVDPNESTGRAPIGVAVVAIR